MINQAVIACGGLGSRMSPGINRKRSKSLIEYRGFPLLQYLIFWCREVGFNEFLLGTDTHIREEVEGIAKKLGVTYELSVSAVSYKGVALSFGDSLDDHFLIVCGHHPVIPEHLRRMVAAAEHFDCVFSAYDSNLFTPNRHERIIFNGQTDNPHLSWQVRKKTHPLIICMLRIQK